MLVLQSSPGLSGIVPTATDEAEKYGRVCPRHRLPIEAWMTRVGEALVCPSGAHHEVSRWLVVELATGRVVGFATAKHGFLVAEDWRAGC